MTFENGIFVLRIDIEAEKFFGFDVSLISIFKAKVWMNDVAKNELLHISQGRRKSQKKHKNSVKKKN